MKHLIPLFVIVAVCYPYNAFGCSVVRGMDVLLPWQERLMADCTLEGYEVSLAGVIYGFFGATASVVLLARRTRK